VNKKAMPLLQKIFYIISFIFLISAFIYLGTKDFHLPKELSDRESFTKEYGITSDNIFVYKTAKEVLETLNTGTAIIYFAYPENKWSASYADLLNDVAIKNNVKEIYYYNFKKDRANNNHYYENIVKSLLPYLPVLDSEIVNLYAPTLVLVRDGNIVFFDDETAIVRGETSVQSYWTTTNLERKEEELSYMIKEYLGDRN